jgi:hypothetical protein
MMKNSAVFTVSSLIIQLLGAQLCYGFADDFDGRAWEEPAGSTFAVLAGPEAGVYGVSFGQGMWLKGTPVFGNFCLSLFKNDNEDSLFSGIGMTIRIMPRWKLAPFIGGGGSFNYSWSSATAADSLSGIPAEAVAEASSRSGKSYWGGHVEAGARLRLDSRIRLVEAFGRHTWSSSGPEADYWLVGVSTGIDW